MPNQQPIPAPKPFDIPNRRAEPDDDLFKELEPTYKPPTKVGMTTLQKTPVSNRFEVDEDYTGDWGEDNL